MGLFRTKKSLLSDIERASAQLAQIMGTLEGTTDSLQAVEEYAKAKKELTDLQIQFDRVKENHARETREIEHKLGLHKMQVEQERTQAVTEAKIAVREENLQAREQMFQQEMEFIRKRMEDEIASQRTLMNQILERLPRFDRTYTTVEHIGQDPDPKVKLELTKGDD